ncbi:DNA helicase II / ATP-dependent DNA helicase PcrA [Pararobbsia alpina]|uniref:ATP-dependent helicase n=1 Tax=Pararobbsia alpina TaxID=621374 RepID=UPI0039A6BBB3
MPRRPPPTRAPMQADTPNAAPDQPEGAAPDYLARLNPQQRAAVEHGVAPTPGTTPSAHVAEPLLVIAGAGSGKTDTLAHRVTHLLINGVDPRRILLLTFSRRAAGEMRKRVERIAWRALGADAATLASGLNWSGTFHGIGARLLREYAVQIGLSPTFTIHDREDSADLMNLVRHDLDLSSKDRRFPLKSTCLAIYSRVVNSQAELQAVLDKVYPWCANWHDELRALFAAYVEAKQKQDVLDYDDLLLYCSHMMSEPTLAAEIGARFDHVLVDEYQDTNALQATLLLGLKSDGHGLMVVGDDAQSIYSFRAATVRNILDFPTQFDPPARIVTLEQNYRSTQPILEASNAVIGLASERFTKNLWSERASAQRPSLVHVKDEADQARFVCTRVLEHREAGTDLKKQAVLFRASDHSGPLEVELTVRNIPFVKFGGLKFLDAAHVKDVLAVLRFAENPRDRVAGFRVMQLLPGIGPVTAGRALDAVASAEAMDTAQALRAFAPGARASEAWPAFVELVADIRAGAHAWPTDLERVRVWYEPHLLDQFEDGPMRMADLVQLSNIASGYPSRERFLTELTLDPPDATSDESGVPLRDEDYLILSTIHSAKGQEWNHVFVLNAVDGCIPSDMATGSPDEIEEERRLLYVAMTRAKDTLDIVIPQRFYVTQQTAQGDRHVYGSRTRFVPNALLPRFESTSWPRDPGTQPTSSEQARQHIDLAAKMRKMWG